MATPEQPKNYITKGISKTLLTPCRRIGLSRSKKTPKNFDSPLLEPKSTPVSILQTPESKREPEQPAFRENEHETPVSVLKTAVNRKKSRKPPVTSVKVEVPQNTNNDCKTSVCPEPKLVSSEATVTNVQIIENNDTPVRPQCTETVNNHCKPSSPPTSPVITKVKAQVHHPPVKRNINFNQLETESTSQSNQILTPIDNNSLENSPVARQKKRKLCVIDSDDEFSSVSTKSSKALSKFTTEEYLEEYSKDPKSFAASLSQDTNSNDVKTVCVNTKNNEVENKDYVAIYYPISANQSSDADKDKKLTVSLERLTTKKSNSSNKLSLSKLSFDTENSDDEMFTSSPVDDKKRKENLVKLIDDMKTQVRQKQETLEKLKQAQIYKKIHSPDKLKITTEVWLKGCKKSLEDLHQKMQAIGPMDLNTLIKKLGIPERVLKKLE